MATMNISLPESMKSWIESQVKTGKFGNTSDFMRDLVRMHILADHEHPF